MRSAAVRRSGVGARARGGGLALVQLPEEPGGVTAGEDGLAPGRGLRGVVEVGGAGVGVEAAPGADPEGLVAVGRLVGRGLDQDPAHRGAVGHLTAELQRVDRAGLDGDHDDVGDVGQELGRGSRARRSARPRGDRCRRCGSAP